MERSRILGAGVWTAVGLAAAFAVVSATSNRDSATPTNAAAAKATVAEAPACCAQDVKAAPAVAAAPKPAVRKVSPKPIVAEAATAGMVIAIDPESGALTMPSAEQLDELRAAAQGSEMQSIDRSAVGLVELRHADGTVSIDLQGRGQDFLTLRKTADGKKVIGHTDDLNTLTAPTQPVQSGLEEK